MDRQVHILPTTPLEHQNPWVGGGSHYAVGFIQQREPEDQVQSNVGIRTVLLPLFHIPFRLYQKEKFLY